MGVISAAILTWGIGDVGLGTPEGIGQNFMNEKMIFLGLLLGGFFAVACLRARGPMIPTGKVQLGGLLRFPGRIERLRRSRWQWFSMVLLMLILRLQGELPAGLEVMAAFQFVVFLALPVRAETLKPRRSDEAIAGDR